MISVGQPDLARALTRLYHLMAGETAKVDALSHVRADIYQDMIRFAVSRPLGEAQSLVKRSDAGSANGHFAFATQAGLLRDLVRSFDADAQVSMSIEGSSLVVKAKSSAFKLPIADPDSVPITVDYSSLPFTGVDMNSLICSIDAASLGRKDAEAVAVREYGNGLCLDESYFAATDGLRIVCYPNNVLKMPQFVLPSRSASLIPKMFVGCNDGALCRQELAMHVYGGGMYASFRRLAVDFPEYQSVLPQGVGIKAEMKKEELLKALQRILLLKMSALAVDLSVRAADGLLQLTAQTPTSKGFEVVACRASADAGAKVNPAFVSEALKNMDGDEVVVEFFGTVAGDLVKLSSGEHFYVFATISST